MKIACSILSTLVLIVILSIDRPIEVKFISINNIYYVEKRLFELKYRIYSENDDWMHHKLTLQGALDHVNDLLLEDIIHYTENDEAKGY